MPPISQPGSRAGLITGLVIFVVLFITATIFAIYYNAQATQARTQLTEETKRYRDLTDDLNSPQIKALENARKIPGFSKDERLLNVSAALTDQLAALIMGKPDTGAPAAAESAKAALDQSQVVLQDAQKKLSDAKIDLVLPTSAGNLLGVIRVLSDAVVSLQQTAMSEQSQLQQAQKQLIAMGKERDQALAQKDTELAQARQELEKERAGLASDRQGKQGQVEQIMAERKADSDKATEELNQANQKLAQVTKDKADLTRKIESLVNWRAQHTLDPKQPIVRQADGQISRLGSSNIVYINRGSGDHLVPGLTFEVYDKNTGIPPLAEGADDQELPKGKASVEVIRVGATSSECRVVKQEAGRTITEGDYIVNLVYDPNTKYQFMVYGDFDLAQNGTPNPQDTDVIKRLINQWGGKIINKIDVQTDFLVLGAEPKIPSFTKEELDNPSNQDKLQKAQAALSAYEEVKSQAMSLHIPILNQNRFLYFTGYYDLAKR